MSRRSHGLRPWLWQRLSALYMAIYLLSMTLYLLLSPPAGWQDWHDLMANIAVNLATGLFFAALLMHAWVGARDVVFDYVHCPALRIGLLGLVVLMLAGCGLWALGILYALY